MTISRTSTERSEEHSRVKRGNEIKPTPEHHKNLKNQGNHKTSFNRKLRQVYARTKSFGKIIETTIQDQWESNFRPHWFITVHWNDLPTSYDTVEGHTRHLRNVFLTQLMGCGSPCDLPDPPERPSAVFFHERSPVICRNRSILPFHTHLHLGELPYPLNEQWFLKVLLTEKVAPRVEKLLKTTTKGNQGVVIKRWNPEHHGFYNLKDYYRYKYHQDPDLVLDCKNSDLDFTK